ncbi:endolytic transglycosylase MltG [Patescibacteria group bacterium]
MQVITMQNKSKLYYNVFMVEEENIIEKKASRFQISYSDNKLLVVLIVLTTVIMAVSVVVYFAFQTVYPPDDFPLNKVLTIEEGKTLKEVANEFETAGLVHSSFWFETIGWAFGTEKNIKAGEYFFENKLSAIELMDAITSDSYKNKFAIVTIPEGFDIRDIAFMFENKGMWQAEELWEVTGLPTVDCRTELSACSRYHKGFAENFPLLSSVPDYTSLEGFLFPDTYYVPINIGPVALVTMMLENMEKKITPEIREQISESGRTFYEIITMASILEKEAATKKDRKIISGILWKRLKSGMPLQVDAVFPYIMGKYSLGLTLEDLKFDSPYNTYLYKGLPFGPITNPGMSAIESALNPEDSLNWFYLSDAQGNVYYSPTYEEHLAKKAKYID